MKKILSVLFVLWFLFVSFSVASNERKYASTRMPGCEENDIIYWDEVWASCNSDYELTNSTYYPWINESSRDINWWEYWRLYEHNNAACPSLYRIPNIQDFNFTDNNVFDDVLKFPAWWVYSQYLWLWDNVLFGHKDQRWYYITTENYFWKFYYFNRSANQNNDLYFFWVKLSQNTKKPKWSLRCIRVAPATQEEKIWNLSMVNQSKTWEYGMVLSWDFGISSNLDFAVASGSKDEYVNAKLNEINDCFLDIYSWHLNTIISAWQKLLQQKASAKTPLEIKKYEKALSKINEIKVLFEKRYKFLFNYSNKNTFTTTGTNYLLSNKFSK